MAKDKTAENGAASPSEPVKLNERIVVLHDIVNPETGETEQIASEYSAPFNPFQHLSEPEVVSLLKGYSSQWRAQVRDVLTEVAAEFPEVGEAERLILTDLRFTARKRILDERITSASDKIAERADELLYAEQAKKLAVEYVLSHYDSIPADSQKALRIKVRDKLKSYTLKTQTGIMGVLQEITATREQDWMR